MRLLFCADNRPPSLQAHRGLPAAFRKNTRRFKATISAYVFVLCWAFASSALGAQAIFEGCQALFPNRTPPVVANADDLLARDLCFDAFAVLHAGARKTPVYAIERLTPEQLEAARRVPRSNRFFAETRLRRTERATPKDYRGSGFDRGHMAAAGDMPNAQAMAQSFSLANMVPQAPRNNRGIWAKWVEADTRQYVRRNGRTVYVFTGPSFPETPETIGAGRVWVPSALFKLVYDPETNIAWAWWVDNRDDAGIEPPISYQELVRRIGIELLPGLSPERPADRFPAAPPAPAAPDPET